MNEEILNRLDKIEAKLDKLNSRITDSEKLVEYTANTLVDHIATLDDELDMIIMDFKQQLLDTQE